MKMRASASGFDVPDDDRSSRLAAATKAAPSKRRAGRVEAHVIERAEAGERLFAIVERAAPLRHAQAGSRRRETVERGGIVDENALTGRNIVDPSIEQREKVASSGGASPQEGCGQSVPQTSRFGAAATNAVRERLACQHMELADVSTRYGPDSFSQPTPSRSNSRIARKPASPVPRSGSTTPKWSMTIGTPRLLRRSARSGDLREFCEHLDVPATRLDARGHGFELRQRHAAFRHVAEPDAANSSSRAVGESRIPHVRRKNRHAAKVRPQLGDCVQCRAVVRAVDRGLDDDAALDANRTEHRAVIRSETFGWCVSPPLDEGKAVERAENVRVTVAGASWS